MEAREVRAHRKRADRGDIADNGRTIGFLDRIGYGLDYKELSRNLPYLAELREGKTV